MTKLTKTVCEAAAYPAEKEPHGYHVVWDQQIPGFGLRCNPSGSKVFNTASGGWPIQSTNCSELAQVLGREDGAC